MRLASRLPGADDILIGRWDLLQRTSDAVVAPPVDDDVACVDRLDHLLAGGVARQRASVDYEGNSVESDRWSLEHLEFEAYSDVDGELFARIARMIDECDGTRSEPDDDHPNFSVLMSRAEAPLPSGAIGFQIVTGDFASGFWARTVLFRAEDDALLVVTSTNSRDADPNQFAIVHQAIRGFEESLAVDD